MYDFRDRIPTQANRKKITFEDGSIKYGTVEFADNPVEDGSKLNRNTFMEVQGFSGASISFNPNGSILETFDSGNKLLTEILPNGNVRETLTSFLGKITIKTTIFNSDGSISEVMS